MAYRGKRFLDLSVAILLLISLSPLLFLIALLVKLFSGSPVIYRRKVVGIGERPFFMLKFRSMVNDQENKEQGLYKQAGGRKPLDDPRITKIGRILRKTSLDELLQLFNVIMGEMSLIGPRPMPAWMVEELPNLVRETRFSFLPGMSGLAQVVDRSAARGNTLDLKYCQEYGLWLDIKIFLKTIPAVLSGRGAC